ncbi:MAG: hypothetical protein A2103_04165 [Gammaproteobacteria bacterium GWF2_41_13]|nr:MAG: hypothetical protein A2103_04165 [Gammaproteobacteria bacterium GWF2_41_13]
MQKLILIGGGGHCRSCIDVIEATGFFDIVGILDVAQKIGEKVFDYSIVGTDNDISKFVASGVRFLITLGQIGAGERRAEIFMKIKAAGGELATIISPRAYVSSRACVGEGTIIMHGALVNVGVSIGANCIINTKALIEHDVQIEDHCHIAIRAALSGGVCVGTEAFIGAGAVVAEYRDVPVRAFIKAASIWSGLKVGDGNADV